MKTMVGNIVKKYFNIGELSYHAAEGSSIELVRKQTGKHEWNIKIYGHDQAKIVQGVIQIDRDFELLYGQPSSETEVVSVGGKK